MSPVNLSNKGISSVVSGLLVACILAGFILSIMILPRYVGLEAKSEVRQEEELREQFLEGLTVSIDNQDNTSTVLTVTNNGGVTAHLVGVSRHYEGRIGTTTLDIRLVPGESKTIPISAGSYDRIGVLTDRGNLYPVKTEPSVTLTPAEVMSNPETYVGKKVSVVGYYCYTLGVFDFDGFVFSEEVPSSDLENWLGSIYSEEVPSSDLENWLGSIYSSMSGNQILLPVELPQGEDVDSPGKYVFTGVVKMENVSIFGVKAPNLKLPRIVVSSLVELS